MKRTELLRLIGLVFSAVTLVVIGDTAGKLLTERGVAPVLIAWSRFLLAAAILLPVSGLTFSELRHLKDWRVLVRGFLIAATIVCILTALKTIEIADAFGAFFIGPLVAYVLAVFFIGEKTTTTRNLLLCLGFFGVMLVVKPGFGFTLGMGFALAAGVFYGLFLVATRLAARAYRPRFLLISQLMIGTVLLSPFGLTTPLPPIDIGIALLVLLSALASAFGNLMLVLANKMAEASLIAPLVYSQLISATVLGVLVFGTWPDALTFLGLGLILVSGIGSLIENQRQLARAASEAVR